MLKNKKMDNSSIIYKVFTYNYLAIKLNSSKLLHILISEMCKQVWENEKEELIMELNNVKQEMEIHDSECNAQRLEYKFLTEKLISNEDCKNNLEMGTLQEKDSSFESQQESYQVQNKKIIQLNSTQKDEIQKLQNLIKELQVLSHVILRTIISSSSLSSQFF